MSKFFFRPNFVGCLVSQIPSQLWSLVKKNFFGQKIVFTEIAQSVCVFKMQADYEVSLKSKFGQKKMFVHQTSICYPSKSPQMGSFVAMKNVFAFSTQKTSCKPETNVTGAKHRYITTIQNQFWLKRSTEYMQNTNRLVTCPLWVPCGGAQKFFCSCIAGKQQD